MIILLLAPITQDELLKDHIITKHVVIYVYREGPGIEPGTGLAYPK